MMDFDPAYNRLALAEMAQRNAAFAIDFLACSFLGQLIEALMGIDPTSGTGLLVFGLVWLGDRVLIAGNNQGQSIGRWAMSLRAVDAIYGKSAGTFELFKREGLIFALMVLLLGSFNGFGITSSLTLFALLPLVVDGVVAVADARARQTLHDKVGGTIVIAARKGFQLDRKLSKLLKGFGKMSRGTAQAFQERYQDRFQDSYRSRDPYIDPYEDPIDESFPFQSRGRNTQPFKPSSKKSRRRRR